MGQVEMIAPSQDDVEPKTFENGGGGFLALDVPAGQLREVILRHRAHAAGIRQNPVGEDDAREQDEYADHAPAAQRADPWTESGPGPVRPVKEFIKTCAATGHQMCEGRLRPNSRLLQPSGVQRGYD